MKQIDTDKNWKHIQGKWYIYVYTIYIQTTIKSTWSNERDFLSKKYFTESNQSESMTESNNSVFVKTAEVPVSLRTKFVVFLGRLTSNVLKVL